MTLYRINYRNAKLVVRHINVCLKTTQPALDAPPQAASLPQPWKRGLEPLSVDSNDAGCRAVQQGHTGPEMKIWAFAGASANVSNES